MAEPIIINNKETAEEKYKRVQDEVAKILEDNGMVVRINHIIDFVPKPERA